MRNFIIYLFLLISIAVYSQKRTLDLNQENPNVFQNSNDTSKVFKGRTVNDKIKPPIDLYKIYKSPGHKYQSIYCYPLLHEYN